MKEIRFRVTRLPSGGHDRRAEFVEAEDETGRSIGRDAGLEWITGDGLPYLRFDMEAHTKAALSSAEGEINALREYALFDAHCPCCGATDDCVDECTFHTDCPVESKRMDLARAALAGGGDTTNDSARG